MSKKNKGSEVALTPTKEAASVENFITQAINANLPVETMERLFALRKEVKAEQAKEEFVRAMSSFQSKVPVIKKTKKVLQKDGVKVRYMYAPLDSIVDQIQKPLADVGLSYTWDVTNENKEIKATATITHHLGHSETSSFAVPIDTEGYMTAPQKYASALTFAKRYSLCNALGISTGDEDTDATDVGTQKDVKSDKSKIIFNLRSLGINTDKKEEIEKAVKEITKLSLEEKNYSEIIGRLEVTVKEKQEYDNQNK